VASDILKREAAGRRAAREGDGGHLPGLAFPAFAPIVDTLVKERLTGAIILLALIVLLVPELLNGPIRPAAHRAASSAEAPPLRSYTIDLADDAHGGTAALQPPVSAPSPAAPAAEPAGTPTPPQAAAQPAPAHAAPSPTPTRVPAAAPSPVPVTQSAAASASGPGWMVQIGSFANRANAERLAREVRGHGFPVGVSRGTSGRRLYRVQVGPVQERAAAEQLAAKLRAEGHGGAVVPN
jgi:DedD protein